MMARSITHVIPSLEVGGAEMMLVRLVAGMAPARWRSTVISLRDRGPLAPRVEGAAGAVASLNMSASIPGPRTAWRLRQATRAAAPDVLQGWLYHGNLAALAARVLIGRRLPVLWNVRSDVFDFTAEKRLTGAIVRVCRRLSPQADRIIYNSHASARNHEAFGFAASRSVVIPNGFDVARFAPAPAARAALRQRVGAAPGDVLIGRVGRYHVVKDFPTLMAAMATLVREHDNVRLILVGPGVDATNTDLVRLVNRADLGRHVHLMGEVQPVSEVMAGFDILCSSSAYGESFPNVLGEAMACAVPCVTTDLGDSAWLVGEAGRVVPPRDPAALAAALAEFVDAGDEGRRRLGEIGRARIARDFSLPGCIRRYEELYTDLLNEERKP